MWFKLQYLPKMHLRKKFEDTFPKYFNVKSELGASGDTSPESMNILVFFHDG